MEALKKTIQRSIVPILVGMSIGAAIADEKEDTRGKSTPTNHDSTVVTRGEELGDAPYVVLSDVIESPEKFDKEPVIIEGTITEVCQAKGCWMKVVPDTSDTGVRVTFKDYGFFVPTDSKDWLVRAVGVFHIKNWTKAEADHLEGEGAKLTRNKDGSATEIGFVASGVELKPRGAESEPDPDE